MPIKKYSGVVTLIFIFQREQTNIMDVILLFTLKMRCTKNKNIHIIDRTNIVLPLRLSSGLPVAFCCTPTVVS
jgi:hypothetical protein